LTAAFAVTFRAAFFAGPLRAAFFVAPLRAVFFAVVLLAIVHPSICVNEMFATAFSLSSHAIADRSSFPLQRFQLTPVSANRCESVDSGGALLAFAGLSFRDPLLGMALGRRRSFVEACPR
jgi:hypothetical protein